MDFKRLGCAKCVENSSYLNTPFRAVLRGKVTTFFRNNTICPKKFHHFFRLIPVDLLVSYGFFTYATLCIFLFCDFVAQ